MERAEVMEETEAAWGYALMHEDSAVLAARCSIRCKVAEEESETSNWEEMYVWAKYLAIDFMQT